MKKLIDFQVLLNEDVSLWRKYHDKTKLHSFSSHLYKKRIPESWKEIYFKGYDRFKEIKLPKYNLSNKISLKQALVKRKSIRKFDQSKLSLKKISTILYYSCGLKKSGTNEPINRFYPSAGARYPLEVYIISLNTQLNKGLYHYYSRSHSLEQLLKINNFSYKKYFNQDWIGESSCIIVISAIFKRTMLKYQERGYRHILIEVGHMAQNFYMLSSALNVACCAIGGYKDDALSGLLDLNDREEKVIYVLALGCI